MNIAEIARMAGVSSAAVSRYFNHGYISEEKREAIRRVVEQTGYRPSMQAQTLRTKRTMMIGVIAPRMASYAVGSVVDGMLSVLNKSDYRMVLAVTQNNPEKELEYLGALQDNQVDGVILIGTVFPEAHRQTLKKMSVPIVIVGQKLEGYSCVYHDDYHAMYDMTKYMFQKGRTKLGYIGVMQQDMAVGTERYRGFCDAVADAGRPELSENHAIAKFSMQSGYEQARELWSNYGPLDGLLCATDEIAVGAIQYLTRQGLRLPQDVLVSGQGDSVLAHMADHSMMTIHYSYARSGELAVEMLLEKLEGKEEDPIQDILLGYHIVDPGIQS